MMAVGFDGELYLLATAEGGRKTPLASGYRSIVRFGAEDSQPPFGVEITFDAPAVLDPGESAEVHFWCWGWKESEPAPPSGTRIFLYEGAQMVGRGSVR